MAKMHRLERDRHRPRMLGVSSSLGRARAVLPHKHPEEAEPHLFLDFKLWP